MTEPGSGDEQADPNLTPDPRPVSSRREVQQALRQARHDPWIRRGTTVIASGLALVLVLGVAAYLKFNANITRIDVSNLLGVRPHNGATADPATNLKPLNILVMGSDTRDLGTGEFGSTPGARSDTTLIVHLAGDRRSAVVISVPRDSMTRAPHDCKDPTGKVADGPIRQWNANFEQGGPACVIRAVEGNTRIPIDHFMVLDFVGFQSMVDALGSVEVCLPTAVDDDKSKLHLPAGRSRVTGEQALAFVRVRYNIGRDGSDLGRINRQQAFLSAMVQEATSRSLLLRPDKLFRFLDAATGSLTTNPEMDLNTLRDVAQSAAGLESSQIRFVTVPNRPYLPQAGRVEWTSAADGLWRSIIDDTQLPGSKPAPGASPTAGSTPTVTTAPVLTVGPELIAVHLTNTSGVTGRARRAAGDLRIQGFKVIGSATGRERTNGVTVAYSSASFQDARTVAAAFPGAVLVKDDTVGDVVEVTLGAGSPNVVEVPNRVGTTPLPTHRGAGTDPDVPTESVTPTIRSRTANIDICSGT